jgi:glycosyltransferase involved in cell wall biosynthesis
MAQVTKILFCCEYYFPSVGGVQEVMRQLAERLVNHGCEVWVATSIHNDRAPMETINGVHVVSFPISGNKVRGIKGPVTNYIDFVNDGAFDVVMIKAAQQWTFDALIDSIDSLTSKKIFIPCGFSGLLSKSYKEYYESMKVWLKNFDSLIFYSGDYQDIHFARSLGLDNFVVIPNGVDEREFYGPPLENIRAKLGIPEGNDVFITVGSRIFSKGHWEVLRAFRLARLNRPTTLVINGNLPISGFLAAVKRTANLFKHGVLPLEISAFFLNLISKNKVIITDLARKDLIDLYKSSTLFIFASHIEYSPLVVFEAAAGGNFFVASKAGNTAEIAQWLGNGKLVEPATKKSAQVNPKDLALAIEDALLDRDLCFKRGQVAKLNIFKMGFIWDKITLRYLEVMQS